MTLMTDALKHDWFHAYLLDPQKYRARHAHAARSPTARRRSRMSSTARPTPDRGDLGLPRRRQEGDRCRLAWTRQSIPLVPINEAIIYRNFIEGAGPRAIGVGYPGKALTWPSTPTTCGWHDLARRRSSTRAGTGPTAATASSRRWATTSCTLPAGVSFAVLAKADEAWPTRRPRRTSATDSAAIADRRTNGRRSCTRSTRSRSRTSRTPSRRKATRAMRRTFTLTTEKPIDKLYFRAAVADKIEADRRRLVSRRRLAHEDRGRRDAGDSQVGQARWSCSCRFSFKAIRAKIVQEYAW